MLPPCFISKSACVVYAKLKQLLPLVDYSGCCHCYVKNLKCGFIFFQALSNSFLNIFILY